MERTSTIISDLCSKQSGLQTFYVYLHIIQIVMGTSIEQTTLSQKGPSAKKLDHQISLSSPDDIWETVIAYRSYLIGTHRCEIKV